MDVLESPLQALFLTNYSLIAVASKSFWTWVALLTAAVSFWRIRAVGHHKSNASPALRDQTAKDAASPVAPPSQTPQTPARNLGLAPCAGSVPESSQPAACCFEDDGLRKGKFVEYYYEVGGDERGAEEGDHGERNGIDGDGDGVGALVEEMRGRRGGVGIRLPVVRTWDLGWYCYQDLTAFNGTVVRLWDDERRRLSPLRRPSAVA